MPAQEQLSALIAKTVEEQTLSLDAVKAVSIIRDRAVALERELSEAKVDGEKSRQTIAKRDELITTMRQEIADWNRREAELVNRERKVTDLEKAEAVAKGKFEVLDGAFRTIFANRIVRETTVTSTPIAEQNGGSTYVSNYETRNTIDRTEG